MKVLITGGSGFIGTNLVEDLRGRGIDVVNLDIASPKTASHAPLWRECDIRDFDGLERAFRDFGPSHIVHLAARTDLDGTSLDAYSANTTGTDNVIRAIAGMSTIERAIFASSRLVNQIGHQPTSDTDYSPTTLYGESKVVGEKMVRAASDRLPPWTIVRPTSIWGPWFGIPYRGFFDVVLGGRYAHPQGVRVRKSFGFVGNAISQINGMLAAAQPAVAGKTLYLCDYQPIEVLEFAREIVAQAGRGRVIEVPYGLLKTGALAGDLLKKLGYTNPPITSFRLNNLTTEMLYDTAATRAAVATLPFSQSAGVSTTLKWMESGQ